MSSKFFLITLASDIDYPRGAGCLLANEKLSGNYSERIILIRNIHNSLYMKNYLINIDLPLANIISR